MNTRLDSRDWETLSAYLDNALSPAEKQQLETRLQTSPELRQILHEMRVTRALLRSVPRRRAPRNFTLTPQMVGSRSSRRAAWLIPTFGFSSALATLLLVISLFVEMFAAPGAAAPMQLVDAPSAAQPEAEMETFNVQESTEPPMIITWNSPWVGGGGGMDLPYGAVAEGKGGGEPAPMMIMEAPVEELEAEPKQATVEESLVEEAAPPTESATEEDNVLRTETQKEAFVEESAPMLPDQAAEAPAMPEATIPEAEPTPIAEEAYPDTALAAPPAEEFAIEEEQPLPIEISPVATSEPAWGVPPTETPAAYADESLPLESQPPQTLESPEEPREGSSTEEVIIFGLASPEDAGKIIPTSPTLAKGTAEETATVNQAAPSPPFPWRVVQLVLLIIAALCAGLAFILHRKRL